jgi:alginate O-acetyltransferase complex protein AlgI
MANLMITMTLGGLWHGANWTFIIWGVFHGLWLCLDRASESARARLRPAAGVVGRIWHAGAVILTFHLVCFGWIFFRAGTLGDALSLFRALMDWRPGMATEWIRPFSLLVTPLLLIQASQAVTGDLQAPRRLPLPLRALLYAGLLLGILLFGRDQAEPFIYFQF